MKHNIVIKVFQIVLLAFIMVSCSKKTAETVISGSDVTPEQRTDVIKRVNANRVDLKQVSGHVSLDLSMGSQSVKVSGDLKMKRNEMIQVTLQMLFITVGRLEFTPEYMMVMDNINKRFVKLPYADVPFLRDNGVDFYAFQALLWNELFLPGGKGTQPKNADFSVMARDKDVVLTHQTGKMILSFLANAATGKLQQSQVKSANANKGMLCDYQGWATVKNAQFPNKMTFQVNMESQQVTATMDISKLREDDSWKGTPTNVDSKKFQELTLQQVWSAVMSLAK